MKRKIVIVISIVILFFIIIYILYSNKNIKKSSIDNVNMINIDVNTDDGDEKIDWDKYKIQNYEIKESITLSTSGIYNLTGTINDGLVTIDTTGEIKIILDNVNITNSKGPAIYIKNASNVVIELKENSINYLTDATQYQDFVDEDIGVILSNDDLIFEGTGELYIISNNQDGIVSKNDLKFISGKYNINSKDDGIRGKDSVYILDGTYIINSLGDGIKSTNATEDTKGFIKILNGTFEINSLLDGIQAEKKLIIEDGIFNITTGGGSINSIADEKLQKFENNIQSSVSAKGIKAGDNLVIENGNYNLNTSDDAIHCNNYLGIKNGTFNITSGDDGIHADKELIIDNGSILILKSYEGLEASTITINNGNINLTTTDDGINVAGGNDSSSINNRPGQNNFSNDSNNVLNINGGIIVVNSSGDGLDANGSINLTGGIVTIYGPENDGNGALDYDSTFNVNGGTLIAGGSSGILQSCSDSSTIYNVTIVFNNYYNSNDTITIVDNNNAIILEYNSLKTYNSVVFISDKLLENTTYKIKVNNIEYDTFITNSITTTIGNNINLNNPRRDNFR